MEITNATPSDSSLIADAILVAIGEDITTELAGERHTVEEVHDLFARLASRPDTQYSYRNTKIVCDEEGTPMGVCISYDGADLVPLRRQFFEEANRSLDWTITEEEIASLPGETGPEEFYLDTLMTLPQYRGKGVARCLIDDAKRKAEKAGKPLGLLCDVDNERARKLYNSVGFRKIDMRPFAGHIMDHLQM